MLCLGLAVERFLAGCAKRSGAESGVDESSGSPGSLLVASSRSRGLVPSRLAKAGDGPGCLAGKRTRTGATAVGKSERPLGTWISSSATVYTPSGATNDKSFSMDPTKFTQWVQTLLLRQYKKIQHSSCSILISCPQDIILDQMANLTCSSKSPSDWTGNELLAYHITVKDKTPRLFFASQIHLWTA